MLHPVRLGIAAGLVWGIGLFLMTILNMTIGYAPLFLTMIADVYPGFSGTWMGSFIGLAWGFIDSFVAFFLIGWIYNSLGRQIKD